MTQEQAIQILIQGCVAAQSKGVFSLEDAVVVKQAVDQFIKKEESKEEASTETVKEK